MKKVMSGLIAVVTAAQFIGSVNARAIFPGINTSIGSREELLTVLEEQGYSCINDNKFFEMISKEGFDQLVFQNGSTGEYLYSGKFYSKFTLEIAPYDDISIISDDMKKLCNEIGEDTGIWFTVVEETDEPVASAQGEYNYKLSLRNYDCKTDVLRGARVLCDKLREQDVLEEFIFNEIVYHIGVIDIEPACYLFTDEGRNDRFYKPADYEKLLSYLEDTGIEYRVIEGDLTKVLCLENAGSDKRFELSANIYSDIGLLPPVSYPEIFSENNIQYSECQGIDLANAVEGDSNNDGIMNMADAVFIMQSITNPDKYQLTAQGCFNADIADTGNGITPNDALVIQQRLLFK